eukprot:237425-Amphidinium_carterae.1
MCCDGVLRKCLLHLGLLVRGATVSAPLSGFEEFHVSHDSPVGVPKNKVELLTIHDYSPRNMHCLGYLDVFWAYGLVFREGLANLTMTRSRTTL